MVEYIYLHFINDEYDTNTTIGVPKLFHLHLLSELLSYLSSGVSQNHSTMLPRHSTMLPFHLHSLYNISGWYFYIQLLEWRSLSRSSNSHSLISSDESSSLNLSSSISICDLPGSEKECLVPFCFGFLAEGGEGVLEIIWLDGVSDLSVGISSSSFGLSIDSNSSFIFSISSNSCVTLSLSFLYQNCKCKGKKHLYVYINIKKKKKKQKRPGKKERKTQNTWKCLPFECETACSWCPLHSEWPKTNK